MTRTNYKVDILTLLSISLIPSTGTHFKHLWHFPIWMVDFSFFPGISRHAHRTEHGKFFALVVNHFVDVVAMAAFRTGNVKFRWHGRFSFVLLVLLCFKSPVARANLSRHLRRVGKPALHLFL